MSDVSPMVSHTERLAQRIGRIDALVFFVVWAGIGMAASTTPFGALPLITMVLVPASALVGWRGAASARAIQSGKASVKHAALEGFYWGMAVALAVWLWGFSNAALAAGTVFDGLSPLEAQFWFVVATSLIPVLFTAGACGAATGIVLHFINLRLVKANPPLNTDAPPNGGAPIS